jgi:serine/threonine protein kinase
MLPMSGKIRYDVDAKIGEGSYSTIYRGVNTKTGALVALKNMRIKKYDAGLPPDVIRELECNKLLKSPYVLELMDYYTKEGGITLVYDYMPSDLAILLNALTKPLLEFQVKALMLMILKGIDYCHKKGIMHRVSINLKFRILNLLIFLLTSMVKSSLEILV